MRYLGLALYAEGTTDHRFLRPLLYRLCVDLCLKLGLTPIEIGEILELQPPTESQEKDLATKIFNAALESREGWHVLFIHADGAGDPSRAKSQRVEPAKERIVLELNSNREIVAVIPIRETEAWPFADGNSLRITFGTRKTNNELGVPNNPREVERIFDPKQALRRAYMLSRGRKRNLNQMPVGFLDVLGERVSLEILRQIPAFQELENELVTALTNLNFFGN